MATNNTMSASNTICLLYPMFHICGRSRVYFSKDWRTLSVSVLSHTPSAPFCRVGSSYLYHIFLSTLALHICTNCSISHLPFLPTSPIPPHITHSFPHHPFLPTSPIPSPISPSPSHINHAYSYHPFLPHHPSLPTSPIPSHITHSFPHHPFACLMNLANWHKQSG